jgi:hypothetical protein
MGVTIPKDESRLINPAWVKPVQSSVDVAGFGNVVPLAQVATSGSYLSLSDTPNLSVYALSNGLSQVATSGSYLSLSDAPNLSVYALSNGLSQVATSGSYLSLSDAPNLSVYALSNGLSQVATSGSYLSLSDTPNLSVYALSNGLSHVATSGSYLSLSDAPNLSVYALSNGVTRGMRPRLDRLISERITLSVLRTRGCSFWVASTIPRRATVPGSNPAERYIWYRRGGFSPLDRVGRLSLPIGRGQKSRATVDRRDDTEPT